MFRKVYSTKVNVVANFIGSLWTALLSIIFVPFYLHYISIEGYGLIGIFTSIQAFTNLLDFGLSPTINTQLARLSVIEGQSQEMHNLKRTLELPNWILAIFIALLLCALSPVIARFWVKSDNLPVETITQAFLIMSVNVAVQFATTFYTGGLMGLQKQVLLNIINIIFGTLRSVGALVVLVLVSPTIQAFLLWQTFIALLQIIVFVTTLKYSLPKAPYKGRFKKKALRKVLNFATGITGISIGSLVFNQTDKIILSRMLNLETFGYYMLAITISSMAIYMIVGSITHAVYPRFSQFVSAGDESGLREFYHFSSQVVSTFLFPIMLVLAFFSYQILWVWTGKEEIAANSYLILSFMAVGTGLNALFILPYQLQLANGWTSLAFYLNIGMIITIIPLMILGIYKYGVVGGAVFWVVLNALALLVAVQVMHGRILRGAKMKWYLEDLAMPFIAALLIVTIGKMLMTFNGTKIETVLGLSIVAIFTFLSAALSTKATRNYLRNIIKYMPLKG